jgi:hypothetical protein
MVDLTLDGMAIGSKATKNLVDYIKVILRCKITRQMSLLYFFGARMHPCELGTELGTSEANLTSPGCPYIS